jgi:N-acetylglucosaminyldiphosphoundecaprenol N-acetyl-beta-D-mannosaminyltransferase
MKQLRKIPENPNEKMNKRYFNIYIEFDKDKIDNSILNAIKTGIPAYVCAVDGNSLVKANENPQHTEALNGALVNLSDSSWIPLLINILHRSKYPHYTGSELFHKWILQSGLRHLFLGSTKAILDGLRTNITKINPAIAGMKFETLPVCEVEQFAYTEIADMINNDNPDIVWVSLGAPKQEQFMYRLKPLLKRGVVIGVGAVFMFYSGDTAWKRAPLWIRRMRLEWLYRTFQEPKRMIKRYWHVLVSFPKLILSEIKACRSCCF